MNGPIIWHPLLTALASADDSLRFVVVGGACRDFMLGLVPKDIDIAVPLSSERDIEDLCNAIDDLPEFDGTEIMTYERSKEYEETQAGVLCGVIETNYTFNDVVIPVQIICRPAFSGGPLQGVSQFDWGILQMWWELGDPEVQMSGRARTDYHERTATLTQHDAGLIERSIERFRSWAKRNPDVLIAFDKEGWVIDPNPQVELDL